MLCRTKEKTGKLKSQSCSKRSLVYEIWCLECDEKTEEEIKNVAGEDEKLQEELRKKKKMYKYIGETNRSVYERAWEHMNAMDSLHSGSYMLKHSIDMHEQEEFTNKRFGLKILSFTKSSFERQILESVKLQENKEHHLLNSKSEFNRCAIPRLTTKIGEKIFEKLKEDEKEEKKKENLLEVKIRYLRKERNKKRREEKVEDEEMEREAEIELEMDRELLEPATKRRKKEIVEEEAAEPEPNEDMVKAAETESEDRVLIKDEELEYDKEFEDEIKRQEDLLRQTLENEGSEMEQMDWEEKIKEYRRQIEEESLKREEKIEISSKLKKCWAFARLCRSYIKDNTHTWKLGAEAREEKRKEESQRAEKRGKAARKKEEFKEKMLKRKITERWAQLPEKEKKKFRQDEEKKKNIEMEEMRENLWKWRRKNEALKNPVKKKTSSEEMEEKIEKIEEAIEKVREESKRREKVREEKKKEREKLELKREKWIEEKLRMEDERKERLKLQKKLKEVWDMMRWVTEYLEENNEVWEKEKMEREQDKEKMIREWEKAGRHEKIRLIREKERKKKENDKEEVAEDRESMERKREKRKVVTWSTWSEDRGVAFVEDRGENIEEDIRKKDEDETEAILNEDNETILELIRDLEEKDKVKLSKSYLQILKETPAALLPENLVENLTNLSSKPANIVTNIPSVLTLIEAPTGPENVTKAGEHNMS